MFGFIKEYTGVNTFHSAHFLYFRFDPDKGFFCQVVSSDKTKCLGKSKGRQYPPIDVRSEEYLRQFYNKYNVALSKVLDRINVDLPEWLLDELKT